MPEPTADKSPATAAAPAVYNPLSILAVLGLGAAALYAGIVIVNAVSALQRGEPLLLPDWFLLLPLAGAGLSLLALRQIRNAEGTLSGERLCQWGLGLSVVVGLAYGAYYLVTGWAIQHQANTF